MVKIIRSTILPASIEDVWDVLRDFNGQDRWHPALAASEIERGRDAAQVGSVRKLTLPDGSELREQLLTLSDVDTAYAYCLLDTPIPLFNYVSHVRLLPVSDMDHTFWQWEGRFDTTLDQQEAMSHMIGTDIYETGFGAIRAYMGLGG
ncbi:SRPBCC family protein [Rhizobium mongolense]|uniref:SRPBCC family protein n=1 Tax=Rhizobium mongolense TaxID=57676 RepID=UPI0034A4F924